MTRYDCILMLSGGKDSCYLAYLLNDQNKRIMAVTNDVGFMSEQAKLNIERLKDDLNLDHLWIKSQKDEHAELIEEYWENEKWGLPDICGKCSFLTLRPILELSQIMRVPNVVCGFTKYSVGRPPRRKHLLEGGVIYDNPYYDEYDCKKLCNFLGEKGYVTDPTITNCAHIKKIIITHVKRFGVNPYEEEFGALLADNQITEEEARHYRNWCEALI